MFQTLLVEGALEGHAGCNICHFNITTPVVFAVEWDDASDTEDATEPESRQRWPHFKHPDE